MKTTTRLRQMLGSGQMVTAPFVLNALHAKIAQSVGFEAVYMTGAGTAAEGGGPTRRDDGSTTQPPCAQHRDEMDRRVSGLGWHGPISVVGAPSRSDGYGVVATPRIWSRGIPGTRASARVAARPPFRSPF